MFPTSFNFQVFLLKNNSFSRWKIFITEEADASVDLGFLVEAAVDKSAVSSDALVLVSATSIARCFSAFAAPFHKSLVKIPHA